MAKNDAKNPFALVLDFPLMGIIARMSKPVQRDFFSKKEGVKMDKEAVIKAIKAEFPNYKNNFGLDFVIDLIEHWEPEPITPEGLERLGFEKHTGTGTILHGQSCWEWFNDYPNGLVVWFHSGGAATFVNMYVSGKETQLFYHKVKLSDIATLQRILTP